MDIEEQRGSLLRFGMACDAQLMRKFLEWEIIFILGTKVKLQSHRFEPSSPHRLLTLMWHSMFLRDLQALLLFLNLINSYYSLIYLQPGSDTMLINEDRLQM